MVDWSDSQTFWLNMLHAALGVLTVAGVLAMGAAVWADLREKMGSKGR